MSIKDAIKVFGINVVCILTTILGVMGCIKFKSGIFTLSLSIVVVIVSLIIGFTTNIKFFTAKDPAKEGETDAKELDSRLAKYTVSGCEETKKAAISMRRQLETFARRRDILLHMLTEYFSQDDNLGAYTNLIERAQESLEDNIVSAIKRMSIFDGAEYRRLIYNQGNYSPEIQRSKLKQYNEHLAYINRLVDNNERLLIEFDNLITEVSRINDSDGDNDLSMLRDTVDAMKQLHFSEEDDLEGLMKKY